MIWALWAPVLLSVVLVGLGPVAARVITPRLAAPVITLGMVGAALSWLVSCCLLAGVALVRVPYVGALLAPRASVGGVQAPAPMTAVAAGVLLVVSLGCAAVAVREHLADQRAAAHLVAAGPEVLVLPDHRVAAYAVGGWPGRGKVITTTGMLEALQPAERQVLLGHELTHLRHGHHHLVLAARLAARVNPLLLPLVGRVAYLCERDADESAAALVHDRRLAARTLSRAALAGCGPATAHSAFHDRDVPARVQALLEPAPHLGHRAMVSLACLAVLGVVLVLAALDSLHDADRLLELLRRP